MLSRNQEQEKMMHVIYSVLFYTRNNQEYDIQDLIEGTFEMDYNDVYVYPKECIVKTLINQDIIDQMIEAN